jgi:hypothetical protein
MTIANPAFAPVLFSVWLGPKAAKCGFEERITRPVELARDNAKQEANVAKPAAGEA